ncbi:MAG: hypothetical protein WDM79_02990 [Terricaulis sp.]
MTNSRPPKKSAMLEVRLSHDAKEALMARCRAQGVSASEFVRAHIERFLTDAADQPAPQETKMRKPSFDLRAMLDSVLELASRPQAAFAAVAVAAGLVVTISPSVATPNLAALFERFDFNRDGALSPDEFEVATTNDVYVFTPAHIAPPAMPAEVAAYCPEPAETAEIAPPSEADLEGAEFDQHAALSAAQVAQFEAQAHHWEEQAAVFVRHAAEMEAHSAQIQARAEAAVARAQIDHATAIRAAFHSLDRDASGAVTMEDFSSAPREAAHGIVGDMDENGDGAVTFEEFSGEHL